VQRSYFINLKLPTWVETWINENISQYDFSDIEQRMIFTIELSRQNVANNTGGPFGATVFDMDNYSLVSAGVNVVVAQNAPIAHAEITAITLATQKLKNFDLGADNKQYQLMTSAQPCIMCYGAIIWSGLKSVVIGARGKEDVEAIVGFDEGPLTKNWKEELNLRGIEVITDVARENACTVLKEYKNKNSILYNSSANLLQKTLS
jgi:tRNA(Arg) A34 adenosine deaminase TadA